MIENRFREKESELLFEVLGRAGEEAPQWEKKAVFPQEEENAARISLHEAWLMMAPPLLRRRRGFRGLKGSTEYPPEILTTSPPVIRNLAEY